VACHPNIYIYIYIYVYVHVYVYVYVSVNVYDMYTTAHTYSRFFVFSIGMAEWMCRRSSAAPVSIDQPRAESPVRPRESEGHETLVHRT